LILHFYPEVMHWVRIGLMPSAIEIAFLAIRLLHSFHKAFYLVEQQLPNIRGIHPFPEPIRLSVGLSVTGLSGNIRPVPTYSFPLHFVSLPFVPLRFV